MTAPATRLGVASANVRCWPPALVVAVVGIAIVYSRTDKPESGTDATDSTPLPARSVAVLAFENRGNSEATDFLAEGIPENVLHQLGRFPGLTVIARGSSFAFRNGDEDLRVIGRKLNVRYLLEGSVQTAGEQLRVTSSLVDAETGASVWSMQFARPLRDIFAVEDEIAAEVARAMKVSIDAGTAALAARSQDADRNFDAYLSFLRVARCSPTSVSPTCRPRSTPCRRRSGRIRSTPQPTCFSPGRRSSLQNATHPGMRAPALRKRSMRPCGWSMPPSKSTRRTVRHTSNAVT